MKRVIGKATLMVMGVFAYLILSITFYQNAMADEPSINNVSGVQFLYYHDDKKWNNMANAMIVGQVEGQLTGWMDAAATIIAKKDGTDWLDEFSNIEKVINSCSIYKLTREQVANSWITFTTGKDNMRVSVATILYVNQVCEEQLTTVAGYSALPAAKPETGT